MNVTLFLTRRCNLACDYCTEVHAPDRMTPEVMEQAVLLAASDGRPVASIVLYGGEPLLERRLVEQAIAFCRTVEKSRDVVFHVKISTNGTLLDHDLVDLFSREYVLVSLSMDGGREAHDAHRKFPDGSGSFDLVDRAASLLHSRLPLATVVCVITPGNVARLHDSVSHLFGKGFAYVIAELDFGAAWDPRSMGVLEGEYRKLASLYARKMEQGDRFYLSPFDEKIATRVSGGYRENERCEMGRNNVSVAPDGTIFPCIEFVGRDPGEWAIGDVRSGIDESRRDRIVVSGAGEKEPCASCALRTRCRNWCGCLNLRATGSLDRVSPLMCLHERMITPIADRVASRLFRRRNQPFKDKFYRSDRPFLSLFKE